MIAQLTGWITIAQCVELLRERKPVERVVSRQQLRRRLRHWDHVSGGRLLRWQGAPGGVLEVNAAVLQQLLQADPTKREHELNEAHERIAVLEGQVQALRAKLRKMGVRLNAHEDLMVGLDKLQSK